MRSTRAGISRRALLGLGAVSALAACDSGAPSGSPSGPAASADGGSTAAGARSTASPASWAALSERLQGELWLPGSAGYAQSKLTENPRFDDARPLAVLRAAGSQDVVAALAFARDNRISPALRSGGHSYTGWSAGGGDDTGVPPSLVIDCRALNGIQLTGTRVTAGAGVPLVRLYSALAAKGRAVAAGSCPTVAVAGLTLGGGVGVLTRAHGLTCDALVAAQVVTADGRVRTVDAEHDPDLFWALRGGGGGHLGVVTSLTLQTFAAPTVHTFYLTWPFSAAAVVVGAWQQWLAGADARLWSTLKLLGGRAHASGPVVMVSGTWTGSGTPDLTGLLNDCPPPAGRTDHVRGYGAAMAGYAGCAGVAVERCHTGAGGALTREALAATSHVGHQALPEAGVQALLGRAEAAQGSGLREAGVSLDALGGAVAEIAPEATAFVHRRALITVQYTATYTGAQGEQALAHVRASRAAMTAYWGAHAYVNYPDAAITDPATAYFGANAPRLAAVRDHYDPDRLFTQPQSY